MLKNYINTVPFTKFIVIEDTLQEKGQKLFEYMLDRHTSLKQNKIYYFVFQAPFRRVQKIFEGKEQVVLQDCVTNYSKWNEEGKCKNLIELSEQFSPDSVVFVDSLANVIHQYGLAETYRLFNVLKNQNNIHQIVTLLHLDLLENPNEVASMFKHLSTLNISVLPRISSCNPRVNYLYKKTGGKIIKEIEEYYFENENFFTKKIEKPDTKQLLEKSTIPEINPETLSTFKIGLTEKDKMSRDQLVLPYLPKEEDSSSDPGGGGKIFYQFDEQDDWDEEDPDDDLDI